MPLQRLLDRAGLFADHFFQRCQDCIFQPFFLLFEWTVERRFNGLYTCHKIAVPCAAPPMLGLRPPVQSILQCGVFLAVLFLYGIYNANVHGVLLGLPSSVPGGHPRQTAPWAVSAQRLKHCQFVHGDFLSVTYLKQPSGWNDWEW